MTTLVHEKLYVVRRKNTERYLDVSTDKQLVLALVEELNLAHGGYFHECVELSILGVIE